MGGIGGIPLYLVLNLSNTTQTYRKFVRMKFYLSMLWEL
jgi:hypothetical protein